MPLSLKPPPLTPALRASVAYATRARQQLHAGISDARVASLKPPAANEHFRRFVYGFSMPLTLMRVSWSNAALRASMRRRLLPPVLFVTVIATIGVYDITRTVVAARHDPVALERDLKDDDDDDDKHGARKAKQKEREEAVERAAVTAATEAKTKGGSVTDVSQAAIQAATSEASSHAAVEELPEPARATGLAAAFHAIYGFLTSKVAKLIATLAIIEWILVWIGREHHDQIAFEMATLTGVPGEELPAPPRLRLDVGWLRVKGWRALRLVIFFSLAAPVVWLVGKVPYVGSYLAVTVEALWAVYWAAVFAIANTFLVWERSPTPHASPWFIRALARMGRIPLLGVPIRLYSRVLGFATRRVWPACMAFEQTTWESAGLALARAIASFPLLYITTRPAFTPAATHGLLARSPRADDGHPTPSIEEDAGP